MTVHSSRNKFRFMTIPPKSAVLYCVFPNLEAEVERSRMGSSATSSGGFHDTSAVVCGTLDDNDGQNRDPNDAQAPGSAHSGLLSGMTTIQDDPLAWSKDCIAIRDSQGPLITVDETQFHGSIVRTSDVGDRTASERDIESLEKDGEHLVQHQRAVAADMGLDWQSAREASCAGVAGPDEVAIAAMQPSGEYTSEVHLSTQTTETSTVIVCTDSMYASSRQVDELQNRRILHQQARKVSMTGASFVTVQSGTIQ